MEPSKRMRLDGHGEDELGNFRAAAQAATARVAAIVQGGSASNGAAPQVHPAGSPQPGQQAGAGSKLEAFLTKLGLARYTAIFVAKGLSAQHVRSMSDVQMREELGMPQEHVSLLKRALGLPSAQPAQPAQPVQPVQPAQPAPPAPPALPSPPQYAVAGTAPGQSAFPGQGIVGATDTATALLAPQLMQSSAPGAPAMAGMSQEMMLKMMQMQEGAGAAAVPDQASALAAVASAGAGNMLQPASEEELGIIQMQMQMQMQVQLAMQAGADPTKALEAMAELQEKSSGHGMPAASPMQAQMMGLQPQIAGQEETSIVPLAAPDQASAAAGTEEPFQIADESAELDNTLYALGQVAEEQAQLAVSAAAFCSNQTATDPVQIQALAEAAQQAAQRARWAAKTMEEYEPDEGFGQHWAATLRKIGKEAAEAAEQAAQQCSSQSSGGKNEEKEDEEDPEQKGKVPCKFFLLGRCWKGNGCEFAHEQQDLKPRPLMLKREEECIYFARGQCTRGVACPFAHGPEELAEISKYVVTLKKEKNHFARSRR